MQQLPLQDFYTSSIQRSVFPVMFWLGIVGFVLAAVLGFFEEDAFNFLYPAFLAIAIGGIHTLWNRKPVARFTEHYFECKTAPVMPRKKIPYSQIVSAEVIGKRAVFQLHNNQQVKVAFNIIDKPFVGAFSDFVSSFDPSLYDQQSQTSLQENGSQGAVDIADNRVRMSFGQVCQLPLYWRGSIGRRHYGYGMLCAMVVCMLLTIVVVAGSVGLTMLFDSNKAMGNILLFTTVFSAVIGVIGQYFTTNLAMRRFSSLGWPSWIPAVVLWPYCAFVNFLTISPIFMKDKLMYFVITSGELVGVGNLLLNALFVVVCLVMPRRVEAMQAA